MGEGEGGGGRGRGGGVGRKSRLPDHWGGGNHGKLRENHGNL